MITTSMDMVYDRAHMLGAWIEEAEIGWHYFVSVDEGGQGGEKGTRLSQIISGRYDSYDEAVIGLNKSLSWPY
jgi:hypothetical protein